MIGPPNVPPGDVAMQLRNLVVRGNVGILVEEEGRGVDPVGAAVNVGGAVEVVGAGGGAQIDVRAGCGALLSRRTSTR